MKNGFEKSALFVAFYDMRAVTFPLPGEMANVMAVGLQWFLILIPQLNHTSSHKPSDSHSKTYLHREQKNCKIWNKNHQPSAILPINRKAAVRPSF